MLEYLTHRGRVDQTIYAAEIQEPLCEVRRYR